MWYCVRMKRYIEHRNEYNEFLEAQAVLNGVIEDYLVVFQKTQPHSPCYNGIKNYNRTNRTEEFIIEVERKGLKHRAEEAERVLKLKGELLDIKEAELRKSCDIYDLLYTAKWVDHKKTSDIIRELDFMGIYYSTSQIYEILKRIRNEIE